MTFRPLSPRSASRDEFLVLVAVNLLTERHVFLCDLAQNDVTKTSEPFIKFTDESKNVSTVKVAKWHLNIVFKKNPSV